MKKAFTIYIEDNVVLEDISGFFNIRKGNVIKTTHVDVNRFDVEDNEGCLIRYDKRDILMVKNGEC